MGSLLPSIIQPSGSAGLDVSSDPRLTLHWVPDSMPLSSVGTTLYRWPLVFDSITVVFSTRSFPFVHIHAQLSFTFGRIFSIVSVVQKLIGLLCNLIWKILARIPEKVEVYLRTMSRHRPANIGAGGTMGVPSLLSYLLKYLLKPFAVLHREHQPAQAAISSCLDIIMFSWLIWLQLLLPLICLVSILQPEWSFQNVTLPNFLPPPLPKPWWCGLCLNPLPH